MKSKIQVERGSLDWLPNGDFDAVKLTKTGGGAIAVPALKLRVDLGTLKRFLLFFEQLEGTLAVFAKVLIPLPITMNRRSCYDVLVIGAAGPCSIGTLRNTECRNT